MYYDKPTWYEYFTCARKLTESSLVYRTGTDKNEIVQSNLETSRVRRHPCWQTILWTAVTIVQPYFRGCANVHAHPIAYIGFFPTHYPKRQTDWQNKCVNYSTGKNRPLTLELRGLIIILRVSVIVNEYYHTGIQYARLAGESEDPRT